MHIANEKFQLPNTCNKIIVRVSISLSASPLRGRCSRCVSVCACRIYLCRRNYIYCYLGELVRGSGCENEFSRRYRIGQCDVYMRAPIGIESTHAHNNQHTKKLLLNFRNHDEQKEGKSKRKRSRAATTITNPDYDDFSRVSLAFHRVFTHSVWNFASYICESVEQCGVVRKLFCEIGFDTVNWKICDRNKRYKREFLSVIINSFLSWLKN